MRKFIYLKIYCIALLCSLSYLTFGGTKPKIVEKSSLLKAKEVSVSGKVTSESGEELVGVSVVLKGTTIGTITDVSGNYSLNLPDEKGTLVFSFIGYVSKEVEVGTQTVINVSLAEDLKSLGEVVVVGYGVQKKSVVTGAISSVKAKDLESMPVNNITQSLQGRSSGIVIAQNSGQPGSSGTIRVRGITSFNKDGGKNNQPLWVVDGVVIDNDGMNYLNQADIESIEVLKDAASQAIYGARAAAGVILVTTKKGKEGKLHVDYNGYYGVSAPARKLDLLNATQYATILNEAYAASGKVIPYSDPSSLGKGTDWQKAIFNNNARRQNHNISLSGGNSISTYFASIGYLKQEGIVATDISGYERYNIRLNSTHKVSKWLMFGQNLGYSYEKSIGLGNTNSEYGGPLSSAINLDPTTPLVETDPAKAAGYDPRAVRDSQGNPYGISSNVGQELTNPMAYMKTRNGNYNWAHNIVGNVFGEATIIKGLKLRSTLGTKLAFYGSESFSPISYLNSSNINTQTSHNRQQNIVLNYNLENTISYDKTLGQHNFVILLGQGAYMDNNGRGTSVTYYNEPVNNFDDATMNYSIQASDRVGSGSEGAHHTVSSLFARLNYNYAEKYLFTAIARRDGSSRFGSNHKYGFFPSFSLGWVTSKEGFWPQNDIVNFLKVRGGYGVVGNDNIGDFAYLSTVSSGRNYTMGDTPNYDIGFSPDAPSNKDLKWEQTAQTNIGFDATLIGNLSLTFDWYKKVTKGILRNVRIPDYMGAIANPAANIADMENTGFEVELGYKKQIREVNISVNGNVSYLQNKVLSLENGKTSLNQGERVQNYTYSVTNIAVGEPYEYFYGFKTQGIFQTAEEVASYKNAEGKVIQPDAKPGDFKWQDLNGDGVIDDKDRTNIGSSIPAWTYGLTFNANYKGFDFQIFGQGLAGNKLFQGLRRLDVSNANRQTAALGRWTGPGTSNTYPRISFDDPNHNFSNPSDFYLQKGDYFRIKVIQLGYSLPASIISKAGIQKARIYLMSENLLTFTKYTGYDPEIGGSVMGIDRGYYPQARSFLVGLNLGF